MSKTSGSWNIIHDSNAICNEIPFFPSLSVLSQCVHTATAFCFHPSLSSKNKSVSKVLLTAIIVTQYYSVSLWTRKLIKGSVRTIVNRKNMLSLKAPNGFIFILFCLLCRKGIFFFVSRIQWYLKLICVCDREREC